MGRFRALRIWLGMAVIVSVTATVSAVAPAAHSGTNVASPVPAKMLGRYVTLAADHNEGLVFVLRLRAAKDPICVTIHRALDTTAGTCFTLGKIGVPLSTDPGARGPATISNARLLLKMTAVPYGKECEGSTTLYRINATRTKLTRTKGGCGDKSYHRPS